MGQDYGDTPSRGDEPQVTDVDASTPGSRVPDSERADPASANAASGQPERSEPPEDEALDDIRPAGGENGPSGGAPSRSEIRLVGGRYRLGDVVGRGGMGTVWQARDEILGRTVAVKELRLPPGVEDAERRRLATRTMREAKAIATIRSRGVVTVYDVVDEGSRPWIVMELIEGCSLADLIRRDGPMAPRHAADIGLAVLDVLRAAHGAGILHRDVKPSNVLVADEDGRVVLTDFGIAKIEGDPSITSTGMLVGAPSYISPERARGAELGPPADLWSLGALLYCCVEGRPPYDAGSALATLAAVMHDPVPSLTREGPLSEVITGLLAKEPAARLGEARARELLLAAQKEASDTASTFRSVDNETLVVGQRRRRPAPPTAAPAASGTAAAPGAAAAVGGAAPTTPAAPERDVPTSAKPPASSGTSGGAGSGSRTAQSRSPRRVLLVAAVSVVLLALLGTAFALVRGDGSDGTGEQSTEGQQNGTNGSGDAKPDEAGSSGPDADADAEEAADDPPGNEPDQPESDQDPAITDPSPDTDPPGAQPENDPDATLPADPEGYAKIIDPDFQFKMALPEGWRRTGIAGQHSGGIYSAPGGSGPKVQVDFTSSPTDDAEAAWRGLEHAVRSNSTDYQRLFIETIDYRGYPTAADWQFERVEDGQRVRVLNRGFAVDDRRGYAIMITCPVAEWNGEVCRALRDTVFRTFQPLD